MSKTLAFIKKEILEMLPPTLYALVAFSIVVYARILMGSHPNLSLTNYTAAIIGALIVGKSVLIADALPLFKWFRKRLIINVAWRVLLYMSIIFLFQLLEELIPLWSKYDSFISAASHLFDEVVWSRFWASHIILSMFIIFYSFITAMIGVIGYDQFIKVFFGNNSSTNESG